jgi:hypothetical protein
MRAAKSSHQSAQQHLGVDHVGLCLSRPPIHREARGLHDLHLDAASGKKTSEPESVSPSLMGQYHSTDLPVGR